MSGEKSKGKISPSLIVAIVVIIILLAALIYYATLPPRVEVVPTTVAAPTTIVQTALKTETLPGTTIVRTEVKTTVQTIVPSITTTGPVTIRMFHMTWLPEAQKAIDDAIKEYESLNPNVKIEQIRVSWGEAHAKYITMAMSGIAPEIVQTPPAWANEYAGIGALLELEALPDVQKVLDLFIPSGVAMYNIKGPDGTKHIYGVPMEGCTWGFFWRKDLFAAAGLDPDKPPTTWEELVDYAKKLTIKGPDGKVIQWGIVWAVGSWEQQDHWLPIMYQAGCPVIVEENGKYKLAVDSPEGRRGMQFFADLVRTYKVAPEEIVGYDWEASMVAFAEGKAAMMFNGGWVVKSLLDNYPNLRGKWGTALPPAGPGGLVVYGYPNAWSISKQAVEKGTASIAWNFLKWFIESKYYNQYAAACGTSSWKKDFTEAYYPGNEDVYKAFVKDAIPYSRPQPYTPKWEEFRQKALNPTLQDLILGKITVEEAVRILTEQFAEIHGA